MNLRRKSRKGITGIEAAIVMIAFVVVAAALAFVVLNMGMFTTQKAKEAIQTGLEGATSALQVDGSTAALVNSDSKVDFIAVPIKLAPGKQAVDLGYSRTIVSVLISNKAALENAYEGALYIGSNGLTSDNPAVKYIIDNYLGFGAGKLNLTLTDSNISNLDALRTVIGNITSKLIANGNVSANTPVVFIVFIKNTKIDAVLQNGEKALVLTYLPNATSLGAYDTISIEIRPPSGAPLTVDRTMPATLPADSVITLG